MSKLLQQQKIINYSVLILTALLCGLATVCFNFFKVYWFNLFSHVAASYLTFISLVALIALLLLFWQRKDVRVKSMVAATVILIVTTLVFFFSSFAGAFITADKATINGQTYYLTAEDSSSIVSSASHHAMDYGSFATILEVFKCDASGLICSRIGEAIYPNFLIKDNNLQKRLQLKSEETSRKINILLDEMVIYSF
jgi:uncharacterized membrane protein (DUF373 family)